MADVVVYGADWCPDCLRTKRLLDRLGVAYEYVDVDEDQAAMRRMLRLTGGRQSIPVVVFPGGHLLVEPADPVLRSDLDSAGLLAG